VAVAALKAVLTSEGVLTGEPWMTFRHFGLWYNGAKPGAEESDE
jgi:hypothetical protein